VQDLHRLGGDERRLLRGLRDDGIPRHQRRRHLAEKDGQRKVPRRDCDEGAAPAQAKQVRLPCRTWHALAFVEQGAPLSGVVAAEVDGLAHFR
jgi:hypothetical protein